MDKDKQAIAERVQRLVLDCNWNIIAPSNTSRLNEASVVSKLETMITLRNLNGPRTFIVKVAEMY